MRGAWIAAVVAAACAAAPARPAAAAPRAATATAPAPPAAGDERRAKEAYFRDHAWSPLRAFARYDFAPGEAGGPEPAVVIGSAAGAGVRLDDPGIAPRHMRMVVLPPAQEGGPWRFRVERLAPGAAIRIGGEDWQDPRPAPGDPAAAGIAAAGPGAVRVIDEETMVEAGPFALRPYVQSGAGILIQFDRRRTEGTAFVAPDWFPVDPAWVFRVRLERFENPEVVSLLTSLGRRKEYRRVGWFTIEPPGGGPGRLRVYAYQAAFVAPAEESLSILFTDQTNGAESYATGRYLDLDPPRDGLHTLDFNRAYNPLCAYTHVYNCPIPPRENALAVAVRAGEKSWPGRPHS